MWTGGEGWALCDGCHGNLSNGECRSQGTALEPYVLTYVAECFAAMDKKLNEIRAKVVVLS